MCIAISRLHRQPIQPRFGGGRFRTYKMTKHVLWKSFCERRNLNWLEGFFFDPSVYTRKHFLTGAPDKDSQSITFSTAPTATCFKNTDKFNDKKKANAKTNQLYSLKPLLCAPSEYTKIPVKVCFRCGSPQREHCMCVRVYTAVRWDCSIYAVMCHTWLWIHVSLLSPLHTANMCDACASASVWQADISRGLALDDSAATSDDALHFVTADSRRLPPAPSSYSVC